MEERIDNETVQQIDLISMLKDIGREWLTILLLAIAAALFADIWICKLHGERGPHGRLPAARKRAPE